MTIPYHSGLSNVACSFGICLVARYNIFFTTCFDIVFRNRKLWSTTLLPLFFFCRYAIIRVYFFLVTIVFATFHSSIVSSDGRNQLLVWICRLCLDSSDFVLTNCQFCYSPPLFYVAVRLLNFFFLSIACIFSVSFSSFKPWISSLNLSTSLGSNMFLLYISLICIKRHHKRCFLFFSVSCVFF